MNWKRRLAMGMLCILLMTDQSIVYAAADSTVPMAEETVEAMDTELTEEEAAVTEAGEEDVSEDETSEDEAEDETSGDEGVKDDTETLPGDDTKEPSEEETPGDTEEPSEEETPGDTKEPSEEETPGDTEEPSEEETPGDTEEPSEEETPGDAEEPSEEETPGDTEEPSEEETPGDTEEPSEEETPGDIEEPSEEELPGGGEEDLVFPEEEVSESEEFETGTATEMDKTVVSDIPEQTYSGSELCPEPFVKDMSGSLLVKGTHYMLTYSGNTECGTASVKISGIEENGYTGDVVKSFEIVPCPVTSKEITVTGPGTSYPYTGKAIEPSVTLKHNGRKLKKDVDYRLTYTSNVELGTALVTITGIGNYSGERTKKFHVVRRKLNADTVKIKFASGKSSYSYTGKARKPKVTVTYKGKKLTAGTDYKVTYSNNINAGTAKAKITGKGIYTGSYTKNFKIKPVSVSKLKITKFSSYSYLNLGSINTSVKFGKTTLKKDKDYTITFKSDIKTGNNTVVVKGKGNFTGSKKMTVKVTFTSKDKVTLSSCTAGTWNEKTGNLVVRIKPGSMSKLKKLPSTLYIVQLDSLGKTTRKRVKATVSGSYVKAVFKTTDGGKTAMMSRYALAVKLGKKYQIITKTSALIKNPERTATMTAPYNGYYEEGGKVTSKKGIQGASEDYLEDLGAQHVLLNMDIADLISTKKKSGFVAYKYNGKTYYFQDMIAWVQTLRYLNGWDNDNPYGWHRRNVTIVLLLSYKSELSYLIHPSARIKGAAPYYALNMKEKKARETFEALFCYLGEKLGDNKKSRVCNWTLGNEVNCCNAWNYSGGLSLDECVENYAQAFQLLYQGVRRTASTSRVFISLDHSWTASTEGHSGKSFLDKFASYMNKTAKSMQWNVNYHPYSQPLTRAAFWSDNVNTTNSVNTAYISMQNIKVLTNYLTKIESKYKKTKGSIRVILGEQGFSAVQGNTAEEKRQAAALGYGYYIAAFNSRIDAYIIRTYLDDPAETRGGLYLGLMSASHKKKKAYDVYKYVDTTQSAKYMKKYLSVVGISSWKKKITNFNESKLTTKDF